MKIENTLKIKKHIPYKLLKFVTKMKKEKRNKYNFWVDYSKDYPLQRLKELLIEHADRINCFIENIESNTYEDLKTADEIHDFKQKFISQMLHFFNDSQLVEIFDKIEVMNFNTHYDNVLREMPGVVIETSNKISTFYEKKEDCFKISKDLRSFFDGTFRFSNQTRVYGSHENSDKFDKEKIKLFHERKIFSPALIEEIQREETKRYFQKYDYNHYYWGVVSYKVVKDEWSKLH